MPPGRKKHAEHANHERWLVSYADFITLLFAFFVIMYAISQADLAKFKTVSESIRKAFGASGPVGMIDLHGQGGGTTVNPLDEAAQPAGRVLDLPAGKVHTAADPDPELQNLKELMEEAISIDVAASSLNDSQMIFEGKNLIVKLAVKDFFGAGKVGVEQDLLPLLDRIGRILANSDRVLRIEGHSDESEEKTPGFAGGWELSAARAAWVAKYWMGRFHIDPLRLGVVGYSHFRPLRKGGTEWDRAANRRIEIVILSDKVVAKGSH
ncbi:MAG: flagellar motor protein MotB [Bacteriovoracia bacterium]